jgi:GTPase SAR1 family protein
MRTNKKICILGDAGVGKTTFIKLLITGTYTENVNLILY